MSNENPLGDRGKANEDKWARDRDREALEKLKQQGKTDGTATPPMDKTKGGKGDCACGDKKPATKKTGCKNPNCACKV